jgi:ATP-dependent helicase/nuclease subunit A
MPIDSMQTVILASAGTGKTFQLSSRYLSLLVTHATPQEARGVGDLSTILATTFTRKAAGEILDRIVQRVAKAACDPEEAAKLDQSLGRSEPPKVPLGQAGYQLVAQAFARSLHRANVMTIDAFAARVFSSLCLELGVPANWRISDNEEDQRLRIEAIRSTLESASFKELQTLLEMWYAGGFGHSAGETLNSIVGELYARFIETLDDTSIWQKLEPLDGDLNPQELGALQDQLSNYPCVNAKTSKPDKRLRAALDRLNQRLNQEDWSEILDSTLIANILIDPQTATFYAKPVPPGVVELSTQVGRLVCSKMVQKLRSKSTAAASLMAAFHAKYDGAKREAGAFQFDDIPRLIASQPIAQLLPDLYYRLDSSITHLLFDEFQDTSLLQFQLVEPIIDECLSQEGRSFLAVGDVKQSLYGWRGAAPQLLPSLTTRWSHLSRSTLAKSYRSAQVVLDAVNQVFLSLSTNTALLGDTSADPADLCAGAGRIAAATWTSQFERHSTERTNYSGQVSVFLAPDSGVGKSRTTARRRACFRAAAERTRDIHARLPDATIAILMRSNAGVTRMVHQLSLLGLAASDEAKSVLVDAMPLAVVASLFHLTDHPGDSASLYHIATSPLWPVLVPDAPSMDHASSLMLDRTLRQRAANQIANDIRQRLADDGYRKTCAWLHSELASSMDHREFRRFGQLIDLATQYDQARTQAPSEFARLIRTKRIEDPSIRRIRVMTVHAAKGLEFDAVILPELWESWSAPKSPIIDRRDSRGRLSPFGTPVLATCAPSPSLARFHPQLAEVLTHAWSNQMSEHLSVLYVAMTRAAHSLDMFLPVRSESKDKDASSPSTDRVLSAAFDIDTRVPENPQTVSLVQIGDPNWQPPSQSHVQPVFVETVCEPLVVPQPQHLNSIRLPRFSPSSLEGGPSRTLGTTLRIPKDITGHRVALEEDPRARGTLLHAFCEAIEWVEDSLPTPAQLLAIAANLGWTQTASDPIVRKFLAMLDGDLREVWSRNRYAGNGTNFKVRREMPFQVRLDTGGSGMVLSGQIDRLVLWTGSHGPAAEIIDFKSDDLLLAPGTPDDHPSSLAARIAHYTPQIQSYRAAVSALFGVSAHQSQATLVFTECGLEVAIPASGP